jgi:signal transduction histidine kinase
MSRPQLRRRLMSGLLAYAVVVAVAVAAHGYLVNERAEHLVWESLLESELAHFAARRDADPEYRWTDTETLRLYGPASGVPVPPEYAGLAPGVHDEVRTKAGLFVAMVRSPAHGGDVLALDITDIERRERDLTLTMLLSTLVVVAALALVTHVGVGWLVRPLTSMARTISALTASNPGQRVVLDRSAPREAEVIAGALNGYLQRIDELIERERAFVNMASHELRTPIAVISGSAEVALDRGGGASPAGPYLQQILQTARDMERLVALLVALAKDPARLRSAAESVDLAALVPAIVRDHEFLAARKELAFVLDAKPCAIEAPAQIARAAIGNLVRNAIENSDRGVIKISVDAGKVTVDDPGHGMSDEEMSAMYTRLARAGEMGGTAGIGLDLIARLCEHLDWQLSFSSEPGQGTRAMLDFRHAVTAP